MSFTLTGGSILTEPVKLTTTGVTTLYAATKRTVIVGIEATEIAGATPALTLALWDGTNYYYLRNAKAMAAREEYSRDKPFALQSGWELRATASAANQIDCFVTFMSPDATALGTWNGPQG